MHNDKSRNKKFVLDFIKKHTLAVLATASLDGKPEAAVVEFSENENLEIIFDTFSSFRKYGNLKKNPHVAVVIGSGNIAVQYEGIAVELNGTELTECKKIHIKKLPDSEEFTRMDGIKFFKIIPKWIRYTDVSASPWKEFEVIF